MHCELKGEDIEFIDPSANDVGYRIVAAHMLTPSSIVRLYYIMGNIGYNRNTGIAAKGREFSFQKL